MRRFEVVAYDCGGMPAQITYRIWSDVPFHGRWHLGTAHYRTKEAAERVVAGYCEREAKREEARRGTLE